MHVMTEKHRAQNSPAKLPENTTAKPNNTVGTSESMSAPETKAAPSVAPEISKKLSAEEQMALYENDLKENDWGHRPC